MGEPIEDNNKEEEQVDIIDLASSLHLKIIIEVIHRSNATASLATANSINSIFMKESESFSLSCVQSRGKTFQRENFSQLNSQQFSLFTSHMHQATVSTTLLLNTWPSIRISRPLYHHHGLLSYRGDEGIHHPIQ